MGTGWRRAFCTSIPRDREIEKQQQSPKSCTNLGFFSGGSSNPSTPRLQSQPVSSPRLRCRTTPSTAMGNPNLPAQDSPRLQCKTTMTNLLTTKSPRVFMGSNPNSPKSPSRFSLFKTSLRISRSSCGICLQSVKTGQGTAIFTAECSHAFHFPCIAAHVRKQGSLVCPVCSACWREVSLLAIHKQKQDDQHPVAVEPEDEKPKDEQQPTRDKLKPSTDNRVYDDDESLLCAAGARFNPIPEADEDEEEEIEEFQGFFVHPSSSSKPHSSSANGRDMRSVEVRLLPEAAIVSVGRNHESYAVALRVKAPPPAHNSATPLLDPGRRAPIDLVTVLDVSGSMTGAKLQMLKRAMRLVISSLGSADRLSIVAFSANAKRLLPLRRMSAHGQRSARRVIDRLGCSQGTCVGDALRKATKVLEDRRERNPVASIMLLSDGQDERVPINQTNRHRSSSHVSSTRFAHLEIPVHASGFGNSRHTQEPAEDAFTKCVGGLLSVVVQDVRLQLGFASGSASAEITAVYSCIGRPAILGAGSFRLGDLYAEEERELLVDLRVPTSAVGAHHVLSVKCSYKDPSTQGLVHCKEQALLVPRPHAVRSSAPKIERLRNHFISTRAVAEARRLVDHNDHASAHHLLSSARALLQSSSIAVDEHLRGLEAELAEIHWRRQQQIQRRMERDPTVDESGEPLTQRPLGEPPNSWPK